MSQHYSTVQTTIDNHHLESHMDRTIRVCLRLMGFFALITCLLFWLSLLL